MTTTPTVRLDGGETDATIDGFESFSARRALELLKRKLGRQQLLTLLADEIATGEAFLRDHLHRSNGEEATGTTTLCAHGITAAEFGAWLGTAFARDDVMLAGHPEHYSIRTEPGENVNIVETLDEQVCSFSMRPSNDSVTADPELASGRAAPRTLCRRVPHLDRAGSPGAATLTDMVS